MGKQEQGGVHDGGSRPAEPSADENTPVRVVFSRAAGAAERRRAEAIAAACGLEVGSDRSAPAAVIVERRGARLRASGSEVPSHPGIGLVRVRRLQRGDLDPLLEVAEVRPGDRVLDATLGFGHDALVFAQGVGPEGAVVGLEASPALAALALAGMPYWPPPAHELVGRIQIHFADHRRWLAAAPDRSFDVVFFDPMFRRALDAAPGFDVLRGFAASGPLDPDALANARRVARRWVVVKDAFPGRELRRLGLHMVDRRRGSDFLYARIEPS